MISICIPVYNYDVRSLVAELQNQLRKSGVSYEILLMDDASSEEYRKINSTINESSTLYIQLKENIGRSKIRNKLARQSRFPYLIFMDCDSEIAVDDYIQNYLKVVKPDIVCNGGRIYDSVRPCQKEYLRWKYGVARESKNAEQRKVIDNFGFESNNFLIDKNIFNKVEFNETLEGYGHEDTFFGIELLAQGIHIEHIDNPLIHKGLEEAEKFLEKTENAMKNLSQIDQILKENYPQYSDYSRLLKTKNILEKMKFTFLIRFIFQISKSALRKNILGKNPSLNFFDIYKLGFFCSLRE